MAIDSKPLPGIDELIDLFGSNKELADVAQIDKSAVIRWRQGKHPIAPVYQSRILTEAKRRKMPLKLVCEALGVPRCPSCGTYHIVYR